MRSSTNNAKKHGDMKGNIIDEYLQMMRMMTLEHL